ncbi:hypothetical protein LJB77_00350 [Ruminococcaceae bacterium OttesenSCG-928-N02]|nr:hypothetical protein [Ruminococcaceae bacterium OttesenSCG-928-N02]
MANVNTQPLETAENKPLTKRRRRQLTGFIAVTLCVIGLGTVIYGGFVGFSKVFDQSEEMAAYEELVSPLVMLDPLEFDSLQSARQETLMQAVIWACFYGEADLSVYNRDEYGALILPAVDIDRYAARLYGPDFHIEHGTFQDSGMEFVYDETSACYTIPITGQVGSYQAEVVAISGVQEKVVTVAYMAPASGGALDLTGTTTDLPQKYMEYVFTRQNGAYYLTAIRESSREVAPAVSTPQTSQPTQVEQPVIPGDDSSSSTGAGEPVEG